MDARLLTNKQTNKWNDYILLSFDRETKEKTSLILQHDESVTSPFECCNAVFYLVVFFGKN